LLLMTVRVDEAAREAPLMAAPRLFLTGLECPGISTALIS